MKAVLARLSREEKVMLARLPGKEALVIAELHHHFPGAQLVEEEHADGR